MKGRLGTVAKVYFYLFTNKFLKIIKIGKLSNKEYMCEMAAAGMDLHNFKCEIEIVLWS